MPIIFTQNKSPTFYHSDYTSISCVHVCAVFSHEYNIQMEYYDAVGLKNQICTA